MPKLFGRTARKVAAIFGVLAITASTLGATAPPATSPGTLHKVSLGQLTGTPDFDEKAGPGLDTSATNEVIRTNDTITYNVEIQTGMTASRAAKIEIVLPSGEQSKPLPPYCLPATSSATPAIADPARILTADSYKSLPSQTISCDLGPLNANQSYVFPIYSTVRPEAPNGTKLADITAKVVTNAATMTTNKVQHEVSAAARFDMQMGWAAGINSARTWGPGNMPCDEDPKFGCITTHVDVMVSAPAGGKGISPLAGSYEFELDSHPDVIYGPGATDSDAWKKAAELTGAEKEGKSEDQQKQAGFDKAWEKYKPNLRVLDGIYYGPNAYMSKTATADRSVRHSGFLVSRWEGTKLIATVTGADTSAWTFPIENTNGTNTLPKDRAFVADHRVLLVVPGSTVNDLALESREGQATGGIRTLPNRLLVSELAGQGLDGTPNVTYRTEDNNYRNLNAVIRTSGTWSSFLTAVPGRKGNTPAGEFNPGNGAWEGLPGSSRLRQGDGMLMDGQTAIISGYGSLDKGVLPAVGIVSCNTWDDRLKLTAGDYGPSSYAMGIPSGGKAAWLSHNWRGSIDNIGVKVEYGHGNAGNGDASTCGNDDSTTGWHDTPEKVPGNDPAQVPNGIYTGVNKVRVLTTSKAAGEALMNFSTALSYQGGSETGEAVPIWLGSSSILSFDDIDVTFDEAFVAMTTAGKPFSWSKSTYKTGPTSSDSFSGSGGDRLIIGDAYSSVGLDVMDGAGTWQPESAEFEAGSAAQFRIEPVVSAAIDTGKKFSPTVEVCLPAGTSFVGNKSSVAPSGFSTTSLKGIHQECAPGGTLVTWNLNGYEANKPIPPITFFASSYASLEDMSVQVKAVIGLPNEFDRVKDRTDTASMNLMSPMTAGFDLTVDGGNSLIDVDPLADSSKPQTPSWRFQYFNRGSNGQIGDIDMTVVLPRDGYADSTFNGTSKLKSVQAVQGGGMRISYNTSDKVAVSPEGVVSGAGEWTPQASYAGAMADVTAIRVQRDDLLVSGEGIALVATTEVRNNRTGDVYRMIGAGGAGAFQGVQVNDDDDNAVAVKGGSVGDRVWADGDGDGLQDANENGIPGVPVTLIGTTAGGDKLPARQSATDKNGLYGFDNLPAGKYTITFDQAWIKASKWGITEARTGRGVNDSAPGLDGKYSFTLTAHNDIRNADAGLLGDASVSISRSHGRDTDWIYRGQSPSQKLTIKNTGDFTVTGIDVTDAAVGPVVNSTSRFEGDKIGALSKNDAAKSHTWKGELKPGQSVQVILFQQVDTQAAADAPITNTVKSTGSWIGGSAKMLCTTSNFSTPADCFATSKVALPSLSYSADYVDSGSRLLSRAGDVVLAEAIDGMFGPGEKMDLLQRITNTGNVPLTLKEATALIPGTDDTKEAIAKGGNIVVNPGKSTMLRINELTTATQQQVDKDDLRTALRLHSVGPNAYQLTGMTETVGSHEVPTRRAPSLFMNATAHDESGNGVVEDKENGNWQYTLANTGNLSLTRLDVQDSVGGKLVAEDGFDGTLSPGEKLTLERVARVPTFDDEGLFRNVAVASAKTPLTSDRFNLSPTASTWLSARAASGMVLVKTLVDDSGDGILSTGEAFHYEFRVVNNSDETYSGVRLEDPEFTAEHGANSLKEPQSWAGLLAEEKVLRPGQSVSWTTIQLDSDARNATAGFVENKASVTARDSMGMSMRSNFSIARASAVGTTVMIAAGAGAGVQAIDAGAPRTQSGWVIGGAILAIGALAIVWLRRRTV